MRADHDRARALPVPGLGDHVRRRAGLGDRLRRHVNRDGPALRQAVERGAERVCRHDRRNRGRIADRADKGVLPPWLALVEEHHRGIACRGRVCDFDLERARAALNQRHRSRVRRHGEVRGFAAGVRRARRRSRVHRHDDVVRRHERAGDLTVSRIVHQREVRAFRVGRRGRRHLVECGRSCLLEERELELLHGRPVACRREPVDDVVD